MDDVQVVRLGLEIPDEFKPEARPFTPIREDFGEAFQRYAAEELRQKAEGLYFSGASVAGSRMLEYQAGLFGIQRAFGEADDDLRRRLLGFARRQRSTMVIPPPTIQSDPDFDSLLSQVQASWRESK